ncbi:MAG: hypothetical protein H8E34_12405 [Bacteroidetes bacterium]|nr:hypothetical protein [Bacteroidota bacterium]
MYRVNDSDYVSKIVNEKIIVLDQLDINSKQSYNSFIDNLSYSIQYSSDDFLILIDKESDRILQNDGMLELDKVIQFGWYYENTHKVNYKLLELIESKKIENLKTLNPNIIINSFDKYRKTNRMIKYINVLSGAFGLCYYTFKDEYDNCFQKIAIDKNKWIIKINDLDIGDYTILLQLFLFYQAQTKTLNDILFKDEKLMPFRTLSRYLESSMDYFLQHEYTMSGFLKYLSDDFADDVELKPFYDGFMLLNERYVQRGLPVKSNTKLMATTKEFIDIAKTEPGNLRQFLSNREFSKTSVFLLGMLHLGANLEQQFQFDNFISSFINLTIKDLQDIEINEKEIIISFHKRVYDKNRNNRFDLVNVYLEELKHLYTLKNETKRLENEIEELKRAVGEKMNKIERLKTGIKEQEQSNKKQ